MTNQQPSHRTSRSTTLAEQAEARIQQARLELRRANARRKDLELKTQAALGAYVLDWAKEEVRMAQALLARLTKNPPSERNQDYFVDISRALKRTVAKAQNELQTKSDAHNVRT